MRKTSTTFFWFPEMESRFQSSPFTETFMPKEVTSLISQEDSVLPAIGTQDLSLEGHLGRDSHPLLYNRLERGGRGFHMIHWAR